jgi:hypothetical protein
MNQGYPTRTQRYRSDICPECDQEAERETQPAKTWFENRCGSKQSADSSYDETGDWQYGQRRKGHGRRYEGDGS